MRIIDIDSHFYEPLDWLDANFPKLASQLPPPSITEFIFQFVANDLIRGIPPERLPADQMELVPGMKGFLDKLPSAELLTEMYAKELTFSDPEARQRLLDEQNIAIQVINSNWAHMPYMQALELDQPALALEVAHAYNSWAGERLHGYTERLIPSTFLDLLDVDWALAELTRMRAAGSRAFTIRPGPVNDERSLTHPDLEGVWSAAEDLGMACIFHTGPAGPAQLDAGWLANGGRPGTFSLLHRVQGPTAKLALAALIFDGVFERHPKLHVWVEELGVSWLPEFLEKIDALAKGRGRVPYELPLLPSEYITRQVRVAALSTTDDIAPLLDRIPTQILTYSSDYPHPEGGKQPFATFEAQLQGASPEQREQFFGGSISELMDW
ncbi:MAG: amidohydrolase family protein [Myxococcales bacterium]|nr:amidohydrolase family protein [Myxococcales bacterium]